MTTTMEAPVVYETEILFWEGCVCVCVCGGGGSEPRFALANRFALATGVRVHDDKLLFLKSKNDIFQENGECLML